MHAIASRFTLASLCLAGLTVFCLADEETTEIDPKSGLRIDAEENWKLIKPNCTMCHSERLLIQQQLDRKNWLKAIRRMQSKENLWDLGDNEPKILDYLSTFYGASDKTRNQKVRRAQLGEIQVTKSSPPESKPISTEKDSNSTESETDKSSNSLNFEEKEDSAD